jgi:hypothetical protein
MHAIERRLRAGVELRTQVIVDVFLLMLLSRHDARLVIGLLDSVTAARRQVRSIA